ncbi:MAG: methylmalonyl-CoA mutase family protein, partial [Thermodesulfobacteriota bacterium]
MDNNRLKINKLFKEFPKVTKKEWNDKITEDLRCKNFDKTLVWNTYENLDIDPFYTRDDINKLDYFTNLLPGEYPFTRTCNSYSNNWDICEDIFHEDPSIANKQALEGIESGLSSINFICEVNG